MELRPLSPFTSGFMLGDILKHIQYFFNIFGDVSQEWALSREITLCACGSY